jgi:chemotaxis protein CheD
MLMRTQPAFNVGSLDKKPEEVFEVFLQPGEFYWGDADTRIRTILGSCVAVTIWHPKKQVGGMCHIILPQRCESHKKSHAGEEKSAKYADEAISLMMYEMNKIKVRPKDCQVKVFGGSNMFPQLHINQKQNIGDRNLHAVLMHLADNGFQVSANHYGGEDSRYIIFDIWSGFAWVKSKA